MTIIVCSYNARQVIENSLNSLGHQHTSDDYEVIVVDSGEDGTAGFVRAVFPEVRLVRSRRRLWPGAARNLGIRCSRAPFISFVPADGEASRQFVAARLDKHRHGYPLVGGTVTDGYPRSIVGRAAYQLEFSALQPSARLLARQAVPHALSYSRQVFDRLGLFPEDVRTGEDSVFNERCMAAGLRCAFEERAQVSHHNPRSLREFLLHEVEHGRGLASCTFLHRHPSALGPLSGGPARVIPNVFMRYPTVTWANAVQHLWPDKRRCLSYLGLSPLIAAGLLATASGTWAEWRYQRRRTMQ